MKNATAAVLEPMGEGRVALESVDVQATLRGLFSGVVVTQTYRNLEDVNIEAIYTFPLPLDAVLMDLSLELNGKKLQGVIQPRAEAEERYEDAMDEGDSAVLLQRVEPGVYTLNIGNILPNEKATIRFRYAELHRWKGDRLRFHLPTTIAPRYGDPSISGLAAHQIPEYALSVNHGFSLTVRIEGALAQADFDCPSHRLEIVNRKGARELTLSGGSAVMDRDFVLVITEPAESAAEGFWALDDEEYVALASFHPVVPEHISELPRCVKLVVDCSGSMGGDSIIQAKAALREIISLLKPMDFFNLIVFGSTVDLVFAEPVRASDENVKKASRYIEKLDANMGGTEIGAALNAAYQCGRIKDLPSDLLLITDGEVWNHEEIIGDARKSGHRIFTVGVGSAVSEAFVRRIAEETNGACELVSPRENMSARIVGHFRRIDQPKAKSVRIEWPADLIRQIPRNVETVYAGDTLHVFGWMKECPAGKVKLTMSSENGRIITQDMDISTELNNGEESMNDLSRVAAQARLNTLDSTEAMQLATHYQLMTEHTSCVLVHARGDAEKSEEVPALRKVPQVLAAGWGGMGTVGPAECLFDASLPMDRHLSLKAHGTHDLADNYDMDSLDIPAFMRRTSSAGFNELISALNARYTEDVAAKLDINTIAGLKALGLDQDIADDLHDLIAPGFSEREIVTVFLALLSENQKGKDLSRHVKRLIRMANKTSVASAELIEEIERLINY